MNDDMPWVDLTPEEIQQLRTNKQQLTEYGKERIRQLMMNQEPYPDEMFEEAERREAANAIQAKVSEEDYQKVLDAMNGDKTLYNPDEFLLDNIKSYHYEVMDEGHHVWMAFYLENGNTGHLNIFLNDGKINTRYEEWVND